jgi:hypothetical protein
VTVSTGASGSVGIKALFYKSEGRGLETRGGEYNLPDLSNRIRPWGLLSLLTEMSTKSIKIMFLGTRVWPVRSADNLTALCKPII